MKKDIHYCIYCNSISNLSDEHIIPYGLSGDLILGKASCDNCSKETCKLEQKLLRGHWWPYRLFLGLKSRRGKKEQIPPLIIKITHENGKISEARLAMQLQSIALVFELTNPSILRGETIVNHPFAKKVYMKTFAQLPTIFGINGKLYQTIPTDKVEIPIDFNAEDLFRFLAKVAHGYSYYKYGEICNEYFLPKIILGDISTSMTYIGGIEERYLLEGDGIHSINSEISEGHIIVYIQLFRDKGEPPPIYKIVVGKMGRQLL